MTNLKGFTKVELLVVLCIITILSINSISRMRNPKGPIGRTIPKTAPREENRITHSSGLSLVAPLNWDANLIIEQEVPRLSVAPRENLAVSRYQRANFGCKLIPSPPTEQISDYTRVSFQGFPAYEKMIPHTTATFDFDDIALSEYELFINRDGEWWRVSYQMRDEMTELPEIMREYINTIRFPPKASEPDRG